MKAPNLNPEDIQEIFYKSGVSENITDVEYLSKGGQKTVFKCKINNQNYALKVMEIDDNIIELNEDNETTTYDFASEVVSRASREIEIMNNCQSEYLVQLGPVGLTYVDYFEKKLIFYTENLINGDSLDKILKTRKLSEQEALQLSLNLTNAINSLWEIGMVHRDIKPQNIMLDENGNFILLDAGIAFDTSGEALTKTLQLVGTPIYMSPEQVENRKANLDFRSDLYLLGLVLYESITGIHPYYVRGMNSVQIANKIIQSAPKKIKEHGISINNRFEKIIYRLLSYQPHLRFRSCQSLKEKLIIIKGEI